jgi:flagellar assembly protein FliH
MSSKVFSPETHRPSGPVSWRQIAPAPDPNAPAASLEQDTAALLAEMERHWEQKVREAHAAALREGEAAGRKTAAAEIQPVLERLVCSIEELGQTRARLRREAEADVVRLALAIARRVLRRELAVDPDAIHGLVIAALEKLHGLDICRVRVHPSHAAQIAGYLRQAVPTSTVEVISDASREPGAVLFETERGNLDASVDTQLQEIERGLADRLRKQV